MVKNIPLLVVALAVCQVLLPADAADAADAADVVDPLADRRLFYSADERRVLEQGIGIERDTAERSGKAPAASAGTAGSSGPAIVVNNAVSGVPGNHETTTPGSETSSLKAGRRLIKQVAVRRQFTYQGVVASASGWQVIVNDTACQVASSGVVVPNCGVDTDVQPVISFDIEDQSLVVEFPDRKAMRVHIGHQQWLQ